nr:integrase, catalytic region, zinc finger, CCHC-type, peptidase aspartic, catalytic [Tanacetum cinerariifolium]
MIQVRLNATVRNIRTDNGTAFVNQTLHSYYKSVGTTVAITSQQNGVVERRNRTLVEAARTMHEWDLVFQPVFDEFFSPPSSVASPVPVVKAPASVESTGSPFLTSVNQDAPSPCTSQSTQQSQSHVIPLSVAEESHNLEIAHMSNDPYFGIPILKTVSEESSSSDVIPTTVHSDALITPKLYMFWRRYLHLFNHFS